MIAHDEAPNCLELPSDLICEDTEALKQSFLSALAQQQPITLSARAVTRVGTAALQLLVALRRECDLRAIPFELRNPSRPLLEALACTGLSNALMQQSSSP